MLLGLMRLYFIENKAELVPTIASFVLVLIFGSFTRFVSLECWHIKRFILRKFLYRKKQYSHQMTFVKVTKEQHFFDIYKYIVYFNVDLLKGLLYFWFFKPICMLAIRVTTWQNNKHGQKKKWTLTNILKKSRLKKKRKDSCVSQKLSW